MEEKSKINYISTNEAIEIISKSDYGTITRPGLILWCEKHKIGKKIVGRWLIDKDALHLLLNGKSSCDGRGKSKNEKKAKER